MALPVGGRDTLQWYYLDSMGQEFGPFPSEMMRDWFMQGFFPTGEDLLVRLPTWRNHVPLRQVYTEAGDYFVRPPQLPHVGRDSPLAQSDGYGVFPEAVPMYTPDPGRRPGEEASSPYPSPHQYGAYWMMPTPGPCYPAPNAAYGFPAMMPQGMIPPMQPHPGARAGRPPVIPATASLHGVRFRGRIKSFNGKQGFGFIESADAYNLFGRDVFLHKAQIGDLPVGTEVTYFVAMNKQGMPQARELATLDGLAPGPSLVARNTKGSGGAIGCGGGRGKGGSRGGRGGAAIGEMRGGAGAAAAPADAGQCAVGAP